MPNRIIRESITTSYSWDQLSFASECFCTRLITVVDDYGRMDARSPVLRAKCFPLRLSKVSDRMIAAWLGELIEAEIIIVYAGSGGAFLQFKNWAKYQNIRARESRFPAPPDHLLADAINCDQMIADARTPATNIRAQFASSSAPPDQVISSDRSCDQMIADVPVIHARLGSRISDLGSRISGSGNTPARTTAPAVQNLSPFDAAWELFPANADGFKTGKPQAGTAFNNHVSPNDYAEVMTAIRNYAGSRRVHDGKVMNMANWLDSDWRQWLKAEQPEPQPRRRGRHSSDDDYELGPDSDFVRAVNAMAREQGRAAGS